MPDVIRAGAQLTSVRDKRWLKRDAVVAPLVVFIHGFTSHSGYMDDLCQYVDGSDLVAAAFDYDSYNGIDTAANVLLERLLAVRSQVAAHGLALVGHSMGGLVAMYAATTLRQHKNDYADFPRINHTHLSQNQQIADIVTDWLRAQLLGRAPDSAEG